MSKTGRQSYRRGNRRAPKRSKHIEDCSWALKSEADVPLNHLWPGELELMPELFEINPPKPNSWAAKRTPRRSS